ncbi:hypothetical protein NUU61_006883 [Penicillium alfredii]|uniref:TLDc domain-containing protein n=1 Tax=Penicillium alfredii TaxID=1506179 RepID=A0A9W9F1Q3_9EURO|nr:uncharacterized protein NUU61_006883 [Penicillium alfredii]KAJ5092013.1 hypothetical protein NUU61_006883 [Penicillium alfredii]
MLPGGVHTRYVDEWIAQGHFTTERVLKQLAELAGGHGYLDDEARETLKKNFESVATDEAGTQRLTEPGFISLLKSFNALPPALEEEAGPILYRCLHYLSIYPYRHEHPPSLTFPELTRALGWLKPFPDSLSFNVFADSGRSLTPADCKRILFQGLATDRNGDRLPFDRDEWRRQARRRAFDFTDEKRHWVQLEAVMNCDDWGDEMYADLVHVLFSAQPELPLPTAGAQRDSFRPLAARLHAGALPLYHFTVSPERLRPFIRLLLFNFFGLHDRVKCVLPRDLDDTTECILRAFVQNSDVGVNWPMFDDGFMVAPTLLIPLYRILSAFSETQLPPSNELVRRLSKPGRLFNVPVMIQISTIFGLEDVLYIDECRLLWSHDAARDQANASELATVISKPELPVLILVSGKDTQTHEKYMFGAFIPCPSEDCKRIQPKRNDDHPICSLFELCPVQDVYGGSLECPAWTISDDGISFGDPQTGVALVVNNSLSRATFTQVLDGEDEPIYYPTVWRGNRRVDIKLEGIEVWCEDGDLPESGYGTFSDEGLEAVAQWF